MKEIEFQYIIMKDLKDTAAMMVSEDYKERFAAEYYQLETRLTKLKAMVEAWDKNELNFTPTCPRELYDVQIHEMEGYFKILQMRAKLEDIEL